MNVPDQADREYSYVENNNKINSEGIIIDCHGLDCPDNFVLDILDYKKGGYYVELGTFHSKHYSNTYQLETKYDWKGVSFEINKKLHDEISGNRKNECVLGDATKFNYTEYFEKNNFPKQIDFLQVDIDGGYDNSARPMSNPSLSLLGLIAIPLNTYRFSFITFEHDMYTNYKTGKPQRDASREILYSLGYSLVRKYHHEDWWVDPEIIPYQKFNRYFKQA